MHFAVKQNNRKRKQHSSSGPANSTGTGNTVGPSPGSPQSTHTPGDGMTTASSLQHVNSVSKSMMMYGGDGAGGIASSTNQLVRLLVLSFEFSSNLLDYILMAKCSHNKLVMHTLVFTIPCGVDKICMRLSLHTETFLCTG